MYKRTIPEHSEKRMFDVTELAEYIGMGVTRASQFGKKCGAAKRVGRRVLYDRKIVDAALDSLPE